MLNANCGTLLNSETLIFTVSLRLTVGDLGLINFKITTCGQMLGRGRPRMTRGSSRDLESLGLV